MSVIIAIKPQQYPLPGDFDYTHQNMFLWTAKGQFPNIQYFLEHTTGNVKNCDQIAISLAEVQRAILSIKNYRTHTQRNPFHAQKRDPLANSYTALLIAHNCLEKTNT